MLHSVIEKSTQNIALSRSRVYGTYGFQKVLKPFSVGRLSGGRYIGQNFLYNTSDQFIAQLWKMTLKSVGNGLCD